MARRKRKPTIDDNKIMFFAEQLARELSHLFVWENLPTTTPVDYLERNLIRHGQVLFYESEDIGHDVLRCEVTGYNRHERPVQARTYTPNTTDERIVVNRRLRYLSDSKHVVDDFEPFKDGVLIRNMEGGQNAWSIIMHFAERLALVQQALDTNLLYANMPYIFQVDSDEMRLSVEKMFANIFDGQPFTIVDKKIFEANKDKVGEPTGIPFIAKEIYDLKNEIKMDFRQTFGFDTAGVDKAERVNTLEITSNSQHTKSVLQIMLEQREMGAEAINAFWPELDVYVGVNEPEEPEFDYEDEGVEDVGEHDSGTEEPT